MKRTLQRFLNHKNGFCTAMFFCFMLVQFIVLRLGNQAGQGYLEVEQQEFVYFFLQCTVIVGWLLYVLIGVRIRNKKVYTALLATVTGLFALCAQMMLYAPANTPFYLALTGVTVLCLGVMLGTVYERLAAYIHTGAKAGYCIGIGYGAAVLLQYVLQLYLVFKPGLSLLLLISCAVLLLGFTAAPANEQSAREVTVQRVPPVPLVCSVLIAFALLMFSSYFNSLIHHLQIASGYTDFNVYTWPRLLLIPGMLLFGFLGEVKGGKFLPVCALCIAMIALLNSVLSAQSYHLNMCLYYISLAAAIAYYHLTFLRLAPRTKNPAVWAAMGRVSDSLMVMASFALGLSRLSFTAVMVMNIAALVICIVFMAVKGDFNLHFTGEQPVKMQIKPAADVFLDLQARYGITAAEMRVFRELVETEDKQEAVAAKLGISVSTLRHHITSIYKKTGVQTRAALYKLIQKS